MTHAPSLRPGRRHQRDSLPLADVLPYLACGRVGDFEPLHLLDDGALGFAIEFDAPPVDTEVDGEDAISGLIDQTLRTLPEGVQWQWFVKSSSFVEPQLRLYEKQEGRDPIARACTSHYMKRWRDAQREGFFPGEADFNFFPRSQSILVSLKSAPLPVTRTPFSTLLGRTDASSAITSAFIEAAKHLQAIFAAQHIQASALCADRLTNWIIDLLFPWRCFDHPAVNTGLHSVREAVGSFGRIDPVQPRGFRTVSAGEEAHHRVVSMLWHPRAVRPGLLNTLALLRPCLSVSLSGRVMPLASSILRLKAQNLINARSATRFNEAETVARAQALSDVEHRLFSEGERLVEGRLQVHVIEPSADQAEEAARTVCSYLQELEIESALEEDIGSSLILRGCLPFTVYETTESKLRRRRRFLSRDFADIHPAGGCWKGIPPSHLGSEFTSRPIVMYSNSLGEPLFLDPSRAERNPHALVVGQSGSGKSFFVHDYLLHLWRLPNVRLYLISIKPDYRKLALLLGRYVELTLDSAESLNPFAGAPTLENQARWAAALSLMITEGRAGQNLSREHQIALQECALTASARNWDAEHEMAIRETVLEDVCLELERRAGSLGRDLAFQLLPYRRGPFRRLFNGERTVRADDRFVFFNLSNILRQPCSAAVSFCVFSLIDQVMHETSLRAVPKGLIADEVWALVQDPFAAGILERSLKAYRSLGGFALPIVQDPRDLDTPAGRVILVNTATKVVLPMDRSGQDEISRFVRLNERELDLVRNLRLVKRRYSEFFVSIEGIHSAKGMVIPDPLRYAISTTDPSDEAELDRLYRQFGDMLQAVQEFARVTPYGRSTRSAAPRVIRGQIRWMGIIWILAAAVMAVLALVWPRLHQSKLPPPTSTSEIIERQIAAEQAANLLASAQNSTGSEPAHAASETTVNPLRDPLAEAPISESSIRSAENLQALVRSLSAGQTLQKKELADPEPPIRTTAHTATSLVASRAPHQRPQIPDLIETSSVIEGNDPLLEATLHADLIRITSEFPQLGLLEVRLDQKPPLARFRSADDTVQTESGWLQPGDSPSPSWILISISIDCVTLMSSRGSLVSLSLKPRDPVR